MSTKIFDNVWSDGFKAGSRFIKNCPYAKDTPEARNWHDGWNEGSAMTLGFPYSRTYAEKVAGTQHRRCDLQSGRYGSIK
jgi:ribosome modulation factor